MRIGIVGYEMEGARSGVGRFLEGLLTGLLESVNPWEWRLYFKGDPFDHPLWAEGAMGRGGAVLRPSFDGRPAMRPILWEQTRLPFLLRADDLDLVFTPAYSLPPLLGVPRMLTLHDLSFEHLPEEFGWRERWRRRHLARVGAQRAERVLTGSRAIAQDLQDTYGLDPAKIGVVGYSVDRRFFSPDHRGLGSFGVRPPYLLSLGTILGRRRLDLVIDAFAAVAPEQPDLQLVIAGQNRLRRAEDLQNWIDGSGVADRIVRLDYVPEEALVNLYAGAEGTFYLSRYEGYGLPPLESLAAGTPVVASSGLALDDLSPGYPFRAELERESVIAKTRELLADDDRRAVAEVARAKLRSITWRDCAERWIGEIETALGVADPE